MIKWGSHCKKCEYYVSQMCDYCNQTGKSRLKEFGVDESLELDDRITDLNNRCTHWQDERNQKEYYAQKRYEELTAKRAEKKLIEAEKKQKEEERRIDGLNTFQRRYTLYCQGLSDLKIGQIEGKDKSTIRKWRIQNKIPPNNSQPVTKRPPSEEQMERLELYKAGLSDSQIAKKLDCRESTIRRWREVKKLPSNNRYKGNCETMQFMKLYEQGLEDGEIAKLLKCSDRTIQRKRQEMRLKSNNEKNHESYRDELLKLYNKGMTDREIANELGKTSDAIRKIRYKMGLPRHD